MALRHSQEIERRLSPEEARAFLQVHAEREAASTTADAPTVEDLAEALGLTPVEARSILREARVRTAPPRPKRASPERRIASIILVCGVISSCCLLFGTSSAVPAPAVRVAPVVPEPLAVPPSPVTAPEPSVQAPAPPTAASPAPSYVLPPPGFQVRIDSPAGTFGTGGPTLGNLPDYSLLGPGESLAVQRGLAATCLDLIRSVPARAWGETTELSLSVTLGGGRWTKLVVPLGPDPQTAEIRSSLTKIVQAAWPQIVRPKA